jgi:hypothetical protein
MYSSFIKVVLVLLGFAPVLLTLYVLKLYRIYPGLHLYCSLDSFPHFLYGLAEFLSIHLFLILFLLASAALISLVHHAKRHLPVGRITLKSAKPVEMNFQTYLFSLVLPLCKIIYPTSSDWTYLIGYLLITILFSWIMSKTYHFNLMLRFMGYLHYEVATTHEITYLMLSRQKIINKQAVTEYIQLADSMLVNVSTKPPEKYAR